MKTIRQWYEDELPADIAALAIRNAEAQGQADIKTSTLTFAIKGGFVWKNTPQGHCFWSEVWQQNGGAL